MCVGVFKDYVPPSPEERVRFVDRSGLAGAMIDLWKRCCSLCDCLFPRQVLLWVSAPLKWTLKMCYSSWASVNGCQMKVKGCGTPKVCQQQWRSSRWRLDAALCTFTTTLLLLLPVSTSWEDHRETESLMLKLKRKRAHFWAIALIDLYCSTRSSFIFCSAKGVIAPLFLEISNWCVAVDAVTFFYSIAKMMYAPLCLSHW